MQIRRVKFLALLAIIALVLLFGQTTQAQGPTVRVPDAVVDSIVGTKGDTSVYLVVMADDPVLTYEGDVAGLPATRPAAGERIDPDAENVRRYVDHLEDRHQRALEAVGAESQRVYDYHYSLNGFAARLTENQAAVLAQQPDVLMVTPDFMRYIQTDNSREFLGLEGLGGEFGRFDGQGVIIGVIDTGIWPEHPSFAPTYTNDRGGTASYPPPPRNWNGEACEFGNTSFNPNDAPFECNNKLLGAQAFSAGFLAGIGGPSGLADGEYLSARDADGHGTHTTSTAGGNPNVPSSLLGNDFGQVTGIAPLSRVAMYKACWDTSPTEGGCAASDLAAAIDQAVADGVDVINYSIGGGASLLGPDDIAFLFAADAGVFVATSAGNSGPDPDTVGGPASVPWITAVGANTQDRAFQGSAVLGDGSEYFGASVTQGTDVLPLVDAEDAGDALCTPGALDPGVVGGNIVLCERGVIARVAKSLAVEMAGGAGMILFNTDDAQALLTDNHYVPSVHINNTNGLAVKAYIDSAGASATAMINGGTKVSAQGSVMADFSSRGPNGIAPDIIKPDVTAPGVQILAGNSPTALLGAPGQLFQAIAGTSMSSPHVAGAGALLKQAHSDWSPAMIKSALMTTARQDVTKEDGTTPADPFDMGAGHIAPVPAFDPGLVYDAGFNDYLGFLCDAAPQAFANPEATCNALAASGIPTDASNLNLASIGIAELAGTQVVSRTVTHLGNRGETYNVSVDAPPGINVSVEPATISLGRNGTATYQVTFTNVSAPVDQWAFGSLTWESRDHQVHSPIAVRPVQLSAPDEVVGTGTDGSLSFDITFGYTGDYSTAPHGLIPPATTDANVQDDPANDINVALDCFFATGGDPACGLTLHLVDVPSGTAHARFSLFNAFTDGDDDLDLYVFGPEPDLPFVGASGTGTSEEQVDVSMPDPGTYWVFVHGWQTDGPDANYTLFNWNVGPDAGNMTVTGPSSATLGASGTITVDWFGLSPDTFYLGAVSHSDAAGIFDLTLVNIDTH